MWDVVGCGTNPYAMITHFIISGLLANGIKWDLMSQPGNQVKWLLVHAFQILFLEFDERLQIFGTSS